MNSVEILDKKQQLKDEANAILDNCKQEIRMLNPDEQNKIEEIKQEINSLNEELRKLEETVELPQEINLIKTDKKTDLLHGLSVFFFYLSNYPKNDGGMNVAPNAQTIYAIPNIMSKRPKT